MTAAGLEPTAAYKHDICSHGPGARPLHQAAKINVNIKMHFNFDIRVIKIVFEAYIMQIMISSSARKNPGKYGCELR
jgi:hypothetical protein